MLHILNVRENYILDVLFKNELQTEVAERVRKALQEQELPSMGQGPAMPVWCAC